MDNKKAWYPNTAEAIKKAILVKFPDAKPNEYRVEWRDNFDNFRKNPRWIASRLLWMVEEMETRESQIYGDTSGWIHWICGIMEGLGWINPGVFIGRLHVDHSTGHDE